MNASFGIVKPKFFIIFRGACILLAVIGLIGDLMILLLTVAPSFKDIFEAQGQTLLLTLIGLFQGMILLVAGIWLFKLKEFGRILILACIIWNLLQSIYFYMRGFAEISFRSYATFVAISIFLINAFILLYFLRRDVKAYIIAHG
jgi:hypothetical protein